VKADPAAAGETEPGTLKTAGLETTIGNRNRKPRMTQIREMSAGLNAKRSFVGIIGTLIGRFPAKALAPAPTSGESATYGTQTQHSIQCQRITA